MTDPATDSNSPWAARIAAGLASITFGTVAYNWLTSSPSQTGPTPFLSEVSGTSHSQKLKDGSYTAITVKNEELLEYFYEDAKTLYETFRRGIRVSNNGPCLGYRVNDGPYQWLSYQEVYDKAHQLGSGLVGKFRMKRGEFLSVFSQNRCEWTFTEQAANMFSLVLVPLYDTLGTESCSYILHQTEARICVCDSLKKVEYLFECVKEAKSLQIIVVMSETIPDEVKEKAKILNIEVHTFDSLVEFGRNNVLPVDPPNPEDLATLCYTSGTTGFPKGAQLTHRNLVANTGAVYSLFKMSERVPELSPADSHLSYLPLAHMFERCVHTVAFMHGMQIGFFRGNVLQLMEDLQALQPTLFCTVPRLLNRLYDKVQAGVAGSGIKQKLLEYAIRKKTALLEQGVICNDTIWDKIVFSKLHALTGGRIRIVITGSAPISVKVLTFIRAAFGCPVFEGYGQTEATAAVTLHLPGEVETGHVGAPIPCNKVKLIDVPEMNYLSANNQGEVAVKGYNVFDGYFKLPEKTAEAFDKDGWLLTGDIGEWLPNGCLKVIDRRKHLFKLAQGEYVAPEKIEQVLTRASHIAQIFVDGNSLEVYVLAVVVPDPEVVIPWAKANNQTPDMRSLCKSAELKRIILEEIQRISRENGLKGFEIPRDIFLSPDLFSVENGLLTPTFKSKRPDLRKAFETEFKDMYENLSQVTAASTKSQF